jgi:hypothetical protein
MFADRHISLLVLFAFILAPLLHDVNAQTPPVIPSCSNVLSGLAPSSTTIDDSKVVVNVDVTDTVGKLANIAVVPTERRLLTTPL